MFSEKSNYGMLKRSYFSVSFGLKLLFVLLFFELVIGGGGHYLEIGPITLRMLLYSFAVMISFVYCYLNGKLKKDIAIIIGSLTFCCLLAAIVGFFNGADTAAILEDIKPLSFMYVLLFFSLMINRLRDIETVILLIKIGSILLGIFYISVILLLYFGIIDFFTFYAQQQPIGEILFRGESLFFYKGFIYLCIGFIFFLLSQRSYKITPLVFLFLCIVLTLTRGFILFTMLIFLYYIFFINRNKFVKFFVFLSFLILSIVVIPYVLELMGDRSDSDEVRYVQVNSVMSAVNPLSFFIGQGFGVGIPSHPIHMELSFLEIFHKQGIIGVFFWLGLFLHIFIMYANIRIKRYKKIAVPFLLSVVFVILQSTTNPYMNNPIGLTIILITVVVFNKLLDFQKEARI